MLHEILERLDKVKKFGGKYLACCPVHNDRNPSMSVTEKDNKVLIYCHACGASGLDVVLPASSDDTQRNKSMKHWRTLGIFRCTRAS